MSDNIMHDKKRVAIMGLIVALAAAAAVYSALGAFVFGHHWMAAIFVAAIAAGAGAQVWFIVGFRPAKKGV